MTLAIVALGANLPGRFASPADAVEAALTEIAARIGRIVARSRLYRSVAWPDPNDPAFVNAAALVETALTAAALLARLHDIEAAFGRVRGEANAPRPLDLDIVYYGALELDEPDLVIPHPCAAQRRFVLEPLSHLRPDLVLPGQAKTVVELLEAAGIERET